MWASPGRVDPDAWIETVHYAISSGITLLDVSDMDPDSELAPLIGRAVNVRRQDLLLAAAAPHVEGSMYLRRRCDHALARYKVDYLDVYYLRADLSTQVESGVTELAELVREGKIRHIGLLGGTPHQLRRAHAVHPMTVLATEYSVVFREAERELLDVARELDVGVVARCPFARGLLGGRLRFPDIRDERRAESVQRMVREAESIAADLNVGMSRLALAWLLSRNDDVVPLPSALDPVQLEMDIAAVDVLLTQETCDRLALVFDPEGAT
ncbi:aldo/keto reductase [Nonomuraea helvata]